MIKTGRGRKFDKRQKNEEVVCSPAEQGDAESWVVFCPEARAAC